MSEKNEYSRLEGQIGYYKDADDKHTDSIFVNDRLDESSKEKLYAGIDNYQKMHSDKVLQYMANNDVRGTNLTPSNPNFFREQFLLYLQEINLPESQDTDEVKSRSPEKAAIQTKDFIGAEGAALYRLALEEERYSKEYVNAVFNASTTHYEGEKWATRPVVFVAGPSGSGKSYAAKSAIERAADFLPKKDGDETGNDVVAVDGGVAREVSQVRKLLLQAALKQGFTGVLDLHKQSGALKNVKDVILNAAISSKTLGIVIPETFSGYINPLDNSGKIIKQAMALENTKVVFARVDGANPLLFQKVVAFLGSRRALKTSGFDKEEMLDLNKTKLVESKIYDSKGFHFGQIGSKLAEFFFRSESKDNLVLNVISDLLLKREDPQGSHNWIDASQGEKGVLALPERAFKGWQEAHKQDQKVTLESYIENNTFPPLIETSAGVELAVARELVRKRIVFFEGQLNKYDERNEKNSEKYDAAQRKLEQLTYVYIKIDPATRKKDKAGIDELQTSVKEAIATLKSEGDTQSFLSKTEKALKAVVKSLDHQSRELKDSVKKQQELVTAPRNENNANFNNIKSRAQSIRSEAVQNVIKEPQPENEYKSPSL